MSSFSCIFTLSKNLSLYKREQTYETRVEFFSMYFSSVVSAKPSNFQSDPPSVEATIAEVAVIYVS